MKKIITLFIVACMLLSVIPMSVSAETINAPIAPDDNITTVYVGEGQTYTNLRNAYNKTVENKTEGDIKIVVTSDIYAMPANTGSSNNSAYHLAFDQYTGGTVYICGQPSEIGGTVTYPTVDFKERNASGGAVATLFTLGSDTVIYDLVIENSTNKDTENAKKGVWINAALYDLTLGRNVKKGTTADYISVTGSCWNTSNVGNSDSRDNGAVISIYSGTYSEIYAGPRSSSNTFTTTTDITLNIYGGTAWKIWGAADGVSSDKIGGDITVNIYKVTISQVSGKKSEINGGTNHGTSNVILNKYNGYTPEDYVVVKNWTSVNDHFEALYVGVQNTAVDNKGTDNTKDDDYKVRFVAVMGDEYTKYSKAGFKIMVGGIDQGGDCNNVYTSIAGEGTDDYTAAELGGEYIFAYTLRKIPVSSGTVTFTVTPYVYIGDTPYYGAAYTVVYNEGTFVSSTPAN